MNEVFYRFKGNVEGVMNFWLVDCEVSSETYGPFSKHNLFPESLFPLAKIKPTQLSALGSRIFSLSLL